MSQIAHRQRLRERRLTAAAPSFRPAATNRRVVRPGEEDFAATPIRPMAQTIQVAPPTPALPLPPGRAAVAPAFNEPQPEGDGFDMHSLFNQHLDEPLSEQEVGIYAVDKDNDGEEDEPQGFPADKGDLAKSVPPGTAQEEPAPKPDPTKK